MCDGKMTRAEGCVRLLVNFTSKGNPIDYWTAIVRAAQQLELSLISL